MTRKQRYSGRTSAVRKALFTPSTPCSWRRKTRLGMEQARATPNPARTVSSWPSSACPQLRCSSSSWSWGGTKTSTTLRMLRGSQTASSRSVLRRMVAGHLGLARRGIWMCGPTASEIWPLPPRKGTRFPVTFIPRAKVPVLCRVATLRAGCSPIRGRPRPLGVLAAPTSRHLCIHP